MNLRVLLCGTIGGGFVTLALSLPLYFALPASFTADWPAAGLALGTAGHALAALLAWATGQIAARWSQATTLRERVRAGFVAGGLAGFIAFPLVGAPAAGVAGAATVFLHGPDMNLADPEFKPLLVTGLVRVVWYTYLMLLSLLLAGAAFGALGGWGAGRYGALGSAPHSFPDTSGQAALVLWVLTGIIAFLLLLMCSPAILTAIAASDGTELGTSLPARGVVDWPVGMSLVALIALTWWIGHWCAVPGEEGGTRLVNVAAVGLVLVPLLGVIVLARTPALQRNAVFWVGSVVWLLVTLLWIYRIGERFHDSAAPLPGELALNSLLLATLSPGLVMLTGVSCLISVGLGGAPFLRTPEVGAEELPTVRTAIEAVFAYHVLVSLVVAAVTAGSFAIIRGSGHWWLGQSNKTVDAPPFGLK